MDVPIEVRAGPLRVLFNTRNGGIESLDVHGTRQLEGLAFLCRTREWGTLNAHVTGFTVEEEGDSGDHTATIKFEAVVDDQVELAGKITLMQSSSCSSSLRFDVSAKVLCTHATARTGFIALHSTAGIAGGTPLTYTGANKQAQGEFPYLVDGQQVDGQQFTGLQYTVPLRDEDCGGGLKVSAVFSSCDGVPFEMEDQRLWTDASYKTYYRPLSLPWPYILEEGDRVEQSFCCTFEATAAGQGGKTAAQKNVPAPQAPAAQRVRVPRIALGLGDAPFPPSPSLRDAVKDLGPQEVVCTVMLGTSAQEGETLAELLARFEQSTPRHVRRHLDVVLCSSSYDDDVQVLVCALNAAELSLSSVGILFEEDLATSATDDCFDPGARVQHDETLTRNRQYARALSAFRKHLVGVPIGGGALTSFTELRRRKPLSDANAQEQFDFVQHSTTALVHDARDEAVMKTVTTLPYIAATVRDMYSHAHEYRVAPSGIGLRYDPWGVGEAVGLAGDGRAPMQHWDPRQHGMFGAAFAVASVAAWASSAACPNVVTVADLWGPHGLFAEAEEGDMCPSPAYYAVQWLGAMGGRVQSRVSPVTLASEGVWSLASAGTVLVANTTEDAAEVTIGGDAAGPSAVLERIEAVALPEAGVRGCVRRDGSEEDADLGWGRTSTHVGQRRRTFVLGPYAVARVVWGRGECVAEQSTFFGM